jgi:hypothetical protein
MKYETKHNFTIIDLENNVKFKISEDPDRLGCVVLDVFEQELICFEPEAAILIAEAMIEMAKIMQKKNQKS